MDIKHREGQSRAPFSHEMPQQTSRSCFCPVSSAAGQEEQMMTAVGAGPPGGSCAIRVAAVVMAVIK